MTWLLGQLFIGYISAQDPSFYLYDDFLARLSSSDNKLLLTISLIYVPSL